MKLKKFPMTEHTYNGLIRVYSGACLVPFTKEEHVDKYIDDAWELFDQMNNNTEVEINI